MLGIYIHIPFCERKCNYCAFSSFAMSDEEQERYISFLIDEIKTFKEKNGKRGVDSMFIGGGTPSLLRVENLSKIMDAIKDNFNLQENSEITIECNPNSLTKEKLLAYKEMGINRISIGVQSLDDDQLKFIGRLHNSSQAIAAVKAAKEIFDNVSVDLLIGLKNMAIEKLSSSIEKLIELDVKHFSTYMLQVEPNTPLEKLVSENEDILPSDEECILAYENVRKILKKNHFIQYEVSNFSKEGYRSRHNLKYWKGDEYIGFGLAAHSYLDGKRFSNASNFKDYYAKKLDLCESLTEKERIEEHIMLGLRCSNGVNIIYLKKLGYDIESNNNLKEFIDRGVIERKDSHLYINPEFYGVNNFIIARLLPE